jgi:enoyl-CoA hydratase
LACFSKPVVTLLSGSPSTSALAVALAGTHRVAGDAFACEIADVRRGAVPPGCVVHALSRLPDGIGAYLMLTGCIIGAVDALGLGLITHCIPDAQFDAVTAALADADPVDPVLDDRHAVTGGSALEPLLELIVKHFTAGSPEAIVDQLSAETGANQMWSATAAVQIAGLPKAAAMAALAVLERAKVCDMREATILAARANTLLATSASARFDAATWVAQLNTPNAADLVLASRAELQSLRRPAV